ncbi:hypothetical protein KEM60_01993 [Austwickia sp. TVS 96-490-7B]|uniref:lysophospholipid acyltransferase family protein n=1 Tax=Austwickia sp. TVS 96-490-7B TaxID=2830843 RepID=UPI001E165371|nr:lysophospholipid acyltransferase family protein [Austwickia sp. TVS 96-490-7B]MBW3085782.1 hypothetical protein [Austwickia sp. TVS 96-490-7B]
MTVYKPQQDGLSSTYRFGMFLVRNSIHACTKDRWEGADKLPERGGFLVCANHISQADPLAVARFLFDHGYPPYFLAKESLFRAPLLGPFMRGAGQIPVHRGTSRAVAAYHDAVQAIEDGKCVVIFPEGTLTYDPLGWPMTGKTGAARIALATGRPVVPLAQWGAQFIRHRRRHTGGLRVNSYMRVGHPLQLDDLIDQDVDGPLLRQATTRILDAITHELEHIRGEKMPPGRWDLAAKRRVPRDSCEETR